MSVKVMNWVWEQSQAKGNDRLVLLAIADCADDNGMNAFPSKQALAKKTLLDARTIQRVVRRLEESGCLTVQRSTARGRANVYTVHLSSRREPVDNSANRPRQGRQSAQGDSLTPRHADPPGETPRTITGGTMPPLPSGTIPEPSTNPPASVDPAASHPQVDRHPVDPVADAVLSKLGNNWALSDADQRRLAPLITEKVIQGWPVNGLIHYLSSNPKGVVSSVAVLATRLQELPAPKRNSNTPIPRPQWCGQCDPDSRQVELSDSRLMRCPQCHPLCNGAP